MGAIGTVSGSGSGAGHPVSAGRSPPRCRAPLAGLRAALLLVPSATVFAAEAPAVPPTTPDANPWSFHLTAYAWLPGVTGNYRAGPLSRAVDVNFVDIAGKLSSIPLAFMGRFEAHYERFGLFLDGNYMDLDFKDKTGRRGYAELGLSTQLGLMDYGLMYRLFGPSPTDRSAWAGTSHSNLLDVYVAGRTLWLTNTLDPRRVSQQASNATVTAPLIGGRFGIDINPDWFVMADGNLGGFGADNVNFTGTLQGLVGYRFMMGDVPGSAEVGYRALRIDTAPSSRIQTRTTLNGPFAGLTVYW